MKNFWVVSLLLVVLSGCGLFGEEDTVIRASGTVVAAETGAPIEELVVALDESGGLYQHTKVVTVRTGSEGHFSLQYDAVESFGYTLFVNHVPYNFDYSGFQVVLQPGETRDLGVIELEQNED